VTRNKLLASALWFANKGMSVIPIHTPTGGTCSCGAPSCSSPGKHPRTANGLKDATTDTAQIRAWWAKWPDANIGIVTGAVSGIVVLDIDDRHDGDETLRDLEVKNGDLPRTWRFLTGGGGQHVVLKHPGLEIRNHAGKIGTGLDVRGDGGYIVAPPSLHVSGRRYAASVDHHPSDTPIADMPPWLIDALRADEKPKAKPATHWRGLIETGWGEGQRDSGIAEITGHLLSRGVDHAVTHKLMHMLNAQRCRPPLPVSDIDRIVNSIARRAGCWLGDLHG